MVKGWLLQDILGAGATTTTTVQTLSAWLAKKVLIVLPSHTMPMTQPTLISGRWNTGINQDLAFASAGPYSCLPDRRVLEKLSRSHHRPSFNTPPRFSVLSIPVK